MRTLSQLHYKHYVDSLLAGRSGDRIPGEERFSSPVHTGFVANTASYKMATGSLSGGKAGGAWL